MLLDRIDIDAHGPLRGVELGPFAEHLNVVSSPDGSGKTAIARFIRDSLVNRDYPLGMMSSSTGRVVWADRHGLLHCRREKDGTRGGRRTVEFESRGDARSIYGDAIGGSWVDASANRPITESAMAMKSIQLPESLVDGVITDTGVTSVSRVVSACVRSGLDSAETYRSLPMNHGSVYADRDLGVDSIGGYRPQRHDDRTYEDNRHHREERAAMDSKLARLHDTVRGLRFRQNELHRWIAELDRDAARLSATPQRTAAYQHYAAISDEGLRHRLDDLDAQMIRWQRALLEVRGLRAAILAGREAFGRHAVPAWDEATLRQMRMDGFVRAIDRGFDDWYDAAYAGPNRPLVHIDEVDSRIDSATRHIDWLLSRYAAADPLQHAWFEQIPASAGYRSGRYASATTLEETLRAIREDLHVAQRHTTTRHGQASTLNYSQGELEELSHSESWLIAAIEGLTRHRDALLHHHQSQSETHFDASTAVRPLFFGLVQEHEARRVELDRVTAELDACLRSAACCVMRCGHVQRRIIQCSIAASPCEAAIRRWPTLPAFG